MPQIRPCCLPGLVGQAIWQGMWKYQYLPMHSHMSSEIMRPDVQNLAETVRHKAFRKRVLTRDLRWSFGSSFEIAVAMYGMMHTAVKGTYTWLYAQNNEPLRAETAYICNDTGM